MNKRNDAFSEYHPVVNFLFFAFIIVFTMFNLHPLILSVSFACSGLYAVYLYGKKALKTGALFVLPMFVFIAVINPLVNHRGMTILAYLPNGNPVTLESIAHGAASAVMLVSVIAWFTCFNAVITSDKFIYIFGRFVPALALILSMSLRMVPRFKQQTAVISNAQKCIGKNVSKGSILERAACGLKILSILVTWALENAVETADSMKSRGYGLPGRSAFSVFKFTKRDKYLTLFLFICFSAVMVGSRAGFFSFQFFPYMRFVGEGLYFYAVFFLLAALPVIINIYEDLMWKRTESKI